MILILTGTIRGAVAFALILVVTGKNAILLQVTTYANLIISTIFMGAAMPHLVKILLAIRDRRYPDRAIINNPEVSEMPNNDITESFMRYTPQKSSMNSKWKKLDDKYLKPFFIYNYQDVKTEIEFHRVHSINEIYTVEFNNNNLDYRNPCPYSIKELDISHMTEILTKDKNSKRKETSDFMYLQELPRIKTDEGISYDNKKMTKPIEREEKILCFEESLGSPFLPENQSNFKKKFLREKLTIEKPWRKIKRQQQREAAHKQNEEKINNDKEDFNFKVENAEMTLSFGGKDEAEKK